MMNTFSFSLVLLCAIIFVNIEETVSDSQSCQPGWIQGTGAFNTYCYKYTTDGNPLTTWFDGEKNCNKQGGHLAWIISQQENDFVASFLQNITDPKSSERAFIGARQYCRGENFQWVNEFPMKYSNWVSPPPKNGPDFKTCAVITNATTGVWEWQDCAGYTFSGGTSGMNYICKAPISGYTPPTPAPNPGAQCDFGWCNYNNFCYRVVPDREEWKVAQLKCENMGANLISIHSQAENDYAADLGATLGLSMGHDIWIGLERIDQKYGQWLWSDHTTFKYAHWGHGQPDNGGIFGEESCTEIYQSLDPDPSQTKNWNDDRCDYPRPFICKKPHLGHTEPPYTAPPLQQGGCSPGWHQYAGRCYKYFGIQESEHKVFDQANLACKSLGTKVKSDLVSIRNVYEQMFVQSMLNHHKSSVWIGLYIDYVGNNQASWTDESVLTYTNWYPYASLNTNAKGCAYMLGWEAGAGYWFPGAYRDICTVKSLPFICAQDPISSLPTPTVDTTGCPNGYIRYDTACYKFAVNAQSWNNAQQSCQNDGSNLVSITNEMDFAFLTAEAHSLGLSSFWIGMNDYQVDDNYVWIDGWPVFITAWGNNQPNNDNGDCIYMKLYGNHDHDGAHWYTGDCDNLIQSYVCKWTQQVVPTESVIGTCPDGWLDGSTNKCFKISQSTSYWDDIDCTTMGGDDMVSIHNRQDNDFLKSYQSIQTLGERFWIGMYQSTNAQHGSQWTDGSPTNFFSFGPNQPHKLPGTRYAVYIDGTGNWTWAVTSSDHSDGQKLRYVCETTKNNIVTRPTVMPTSSTVMPSSSSGIVTSSAKISTSAASTTIKTTQPTTTAPVTTQSSVTTPNLSSTQVSQSSVSVSTMNSGGKSPTTQPGSSSPSVSTQSTSPPSTQGALGLHPTGRSLFLIYSVPLVLTYLLYWKYEA